MPFFGITELSESENNPDDVIWFIFVLPFKFTPESLYYKPVVWSFKEIGVKQLEARKLHYRKCRTQCFGGLNRDFKISLPLVQFCPFSSKSISQRPPKLGGSRILNLNIVTTFFLHILYSIFGFSLSFSVGFSVMSACHRLVQWSVSMLLLLFVCNFNLNVSSKMLRWYTNKPVENDRSRDVWKIALLHKVLEWSF